MATLRSHVLIDRSADTVWQVVRDVPGISRWFPAITASSGDQQRRSVTLADGSTLDEQVVTLDDDLRRLQYRVIGGDLPVTAHLGTVDVLALDADRSLVVYSTEIEPAELAAAFGPACAEGLAGLRAAVS
ncbi:MULTISPECIES: SRPBCC family protein [Nocardia]|uniref:Polyketide cyclase / dehydrase and lipid transport n=1 Tax=Nocardia farcinica TaxID=37329 RepID=A0A0H5NES8_NOCFR|nr:MULTISPECIES: SRPBCC family protein [Nocardia]SLI22974.1 MxaD protein [Mycobacteroides abscessus subsp. abscessus]AXK88921.1 SRPBCC family protein [Nocardia farcinica]MBA4857988.1 SRPBCC family protein [Nocardia farcinica]MBC9819263.1 SRPBCC family protein [Nocardia farcinica]MBF6185691.1 SRPBCC family protein [Nocardia farcinica]